MAVYYYLKFNKLIIYICILTISSETRKTKITKFVQTETLYGTVNYEIENFKFTIVTHKYEDRVKRVLANEDRQGEIIFKPTTLLALIN